MKSRFRALTIFGTITDTTAATIALIAKLEPIPIKTDMILEPPRVKPSTTASAMPAASCMPAHIS